MTNPTLPPLYKSPRPLQARLDGERSLRGEPNFAFAASINSIPLMASEFPVACKHYPILFTDAAAAPPVALLGLRREENLFVDSNGAWTRGAYIPAYLRRYPFIFMESADHSEFTLCVDEAADSIVADRSNPFFIDEKPTQLTENALAFAKEFQGQNAFTAEFVDAVVGAGLLVEKRADITLSGGERFSLSGFKVIDEALFNQLPADVFLTWRARGWPALVYAHLISIGNWSDLIDRLAEKTTANTTA